MDMQNTSNETLSSSNSKRSSFLETHVLRKSCGSSRASTKSISLSEKNFFVHSLPFYINETDRLISDQGLNIPKKCLPSSLQRKVRDKSYYQGVIRIKVKEIREEIRKLQKEIDLLNIDHSTFLPYKEKAELKAAELENLQNTLANYNIVDDMFNRDTQLDEVMVELKDLKNKNSEENAEVEKLFEIRNQREGVIKEMETDLEQEKNVSDILTTNINLQLRKKYVTLKRINDKLQSSWSEQERELNELRDTQKVLENRCIEDNNVEVLQLLRRLKIVEDQKHVLLSKKSFASVSEEKEYLRKHFQESNDLLKNISQETQNSLKEIKDTKSELEATNTEASQLYSERQERFLKLKKKENAIDDFLSSCSHQQHDLLSELKQAERKVITSLTEISNDLRDFNPTMHNSEHTENESRNGKDTEWYPKSQFLKAAFDLNEANSFEKKVYEELQSIKGEIAEKEKIISMYSNIEGLIRDMKMRENKLIVEKQKSQKQKQTLKFILDDLQKHHNSLIEILNNTEIYAKLTKLEKKWHLLEKENFSMKNFIESKRLETNYFRIRENVRRIHSELNLML